MDFDHYSLRIFSQVVTQNSFSGAARNLGITQPAVSQQIGRLEAQLGARLFERVGREVIVTSLGRDLLALTVTLLEEAESFRDRLQNNQASPAGTVRYAMPESCQWTPHFRKIMGQIAEFPDIRFEIGILPNEQILQALLEGRLDFGFVVGEHLNPELRFEKFADERYSAVAADSKFFGPLTSRNSAHLRLISYPGWEATATQWLKAAGLWKSFRATLNRPTVSIGTLAGAIHAAQEGAGVALLPTHCVAEELKSKRLREFQLNGKVASHPVHIARRGREKLPRRVELVLGLLKTAKRNQGE